MSMDVTQLYALWKEKATRDIDIIQELNEIGEDENAIFERFYKDLEFGTAGLRGIIGAGTNRMNIYTVGRATQGLAQYLNATYQNPAVAIAYDSRIKSTLFAQEAACVLAANGIRVHFFPELMPTPILSYAVRELHCHSGIIITASHNSYEYNGYKCYSPDGFQITDHVAEEVYRYIEKVDPLSGIQTLPFEEGVQSGHIQMIAPALVEAFLETVAAQRIHPESYDKTDLSVVYTPLHGAGNKPVRAVLSRAGLKKLTVVPEQELPDGFFTTCPYPNPEIRQVYEGAIKIAQAIQADLLLATDPDCDRVGIAVPCDGEYRLLSGNETGILLLHYVLSERKALGTLPAHPLAIKTIVSSPLAQAIAEKYGCEMLNLLTGFKYIGETITALEEKGEKDRFVFAYEESYGYLVGTHARDKDAVVASLLICEMAAFYKTKGQSLLDVLQHLYADFGIYLHMQLNLTFEGASGMQKMQDIMAMLRKNTPLQLGGQKALALSDYETSLTTDLATMGTAPIDLPKSNVFSLSLEGQAQVIIRPSGTEPKIKVYITACGDRQNDAQTIAESIARDVYKLLDFPLPDHF